MRVATGGRLQQRRAMGFALQHRRAVVVRPDAALEQRIAIEQQVMRGDGGGHVGRRGADEIDGVAGGDVFQHHAQGRKFFTQRQQVTLDEDALAIEDVDRRIGDLAVHQQRQLMFLHRLQHGIDVRQIAHTRLRIGGGAGRVILHRENAVAGGSTGDVVGGGGFREVQRHQRLEARAGRQAGEDPLKVGLGLGHGGHRRLEVRHHDGAGEPLCRMRDDRRQRLAIAQVQVPVIGAGDFQARRVHGVQARNSLRDGDRATGDHAIRPWYRGRAKSRAVAPPKRRTPMVATTTSARRGTLHCATFRIARP